MLTASFLQPFTSQPHLLQPSGLGGWHACCRSQGLLVQHMHQDPIWGSQKCVPAGLVSLVLMKSGRAWLAWSSGCWTGSRPQDADVGQGVRGEIRKPGHSSIFPL